MEPGLEFFLFQEEGIRFASELGGALIADEMGAGKSIQAIGVINEDPTIRKVLRRTFTSRSRRLDTTILSRTCSRRATNTSTTTSSTA